MRAAVSNLAFSPDGRAIAFYHGGVVGTIKRISTDGGAAVTVATTEAVPRGMTWGGDSLLLSTGTSILRLPASSGGTPEKVIELPAGESAARPQLLPDGRTILFTVASGSGPEIWAAAKVVVQRPGEPRTTIFEGGTDARFVESGHLVYAQRGSLFAVPFDPSTLKLLGARVAGRGGCAPWNWQWFIRSPFFRVVQRNPHLPAGARFSVARLPPRDRLVRPVWRTTDAEGAARTLQRTAHVS